MDQLQEKTISYWRSLLISSSINYETIIDIIQTIVKKYEYHSLDFSTMHLCTTSISIELDKFINCGVLHVYEISWAGRDILLIFKLECIDNWAHIVVNLDRHYAFKNTITHIEDFSRVYNFSVPSSNLFKKARVYLIRTTV